MIKKILLALALFSFASIACKADVMRLAVTTSFHNSGLSDVLLPEIKRDIGIEIQLLVVGTGQALRLGSAGDVDAILVHSRAAEDQFVAEGHGTHRREIMYNDFVFVGPIADPAGLKSAQNARDGVGKVAAAKSTFVSRGDDSGTHKKELSIWAGAGLDPKTFDPWYKAVGAGMGAALNTASGLNAYILTDRASWLNFGNKGGLELLFAGDPELFNQYAFLPVSSARHKHIKTNLNSKLEAWLTSARAQELINGYKIDEQTLFVFNAEATP